MILLLSATQTFLIVVYDIYMLSLQVSISYLLGQHGVESSKYDVTIENNIPRGRCPYIV